MTRTARQKAIRRARQEAKGAPVRPACPTPAKKAYAEASEAIGRALHRSYKAGRPMRVYDCPCGFQHLTKRVTLIGSVA